MPVVLKCDTNALLKYMRECDKDVTCLDVARKFGIEHNTVFGFAKRHGITMRMQKTGKPVRAEQKRILDFIKANPGMTYKEMAVELGVTNNSIFKLLKYNDLPHRPIRSPKENVIEGNELFNVDDHETWIV